MRLIADLHVHSRYSRATSREMTPEGLWKWAQIKGITLVGTGDFTHPAWLAELKEKTEPLGNGLFGLKKSLMTEGVPSLCAAPVFFMLSSEISSIYSKNGKTRKVHSLVFVPDFLDAARINMALSRIGNLSSDGRPILGLDAKELLKIVMDISPEALLVPAHVWTPHFSVFGAMSGFDSMEECYEELTPHIRAVETGLSSDPPMNWRLSALDGITLISNSDAHSPAKMGREANIFDTEASFEAVKRAITRGEGFRGTIEFFPEEGKYHYDGHRSCSVNFSPKETEEHNSLCPVCGKKVTVGVMNRVEKLSDREGGFRPRGAPEFRSLVPLAEVIAETLERGIGTRTVDREYQALVQRLGNEFTILMDAPLSDIERAASPLISEAISRVRCGRVHITPGYDGEYGKIKIFDGDERRNIRGQARLF